MTSVQLICHRDIWTVVDKWFVGSYGHSKTGRVPQDRIKARSADLVEVTLSGVSLVGLLKVTWEARSSQYADGAAIARRTYDQVAKVIDAVDPDADPGQPIPPIVLDDKLGEQAAG